MDECKILFRLILPVTVATTLTDTQLVNYLVCTYSKRLLLIKPIHVHLGHPFLLKYSQAESRDYGITKLSWTHRLVKKPATSFYGIKYKVLTLGIHLRPSDPSSCQPFATE